MKKLIIIFLFPVIYISGFSQSSPEKFYVGTFTSEGAEGIYLCEFNTQTGEITLDRTFRGISDPSFLKISPDRKTLYAVTRLPDGSNRPDGCIEAYHIDSEGNLEFLNRQDSHGSGPCHVDVSPDGSLAAIATYGGGTVSLYPLSADGSLLPASSTVINKGSGHDKSRQSTPHAHSIKFYYSGDMVFSADLGTDHLNILKIEDNKFIYADQKHVKLSPGAGPRHFDFHPSGKIIYVINELNSTVTAIKNKGVTWKIFQVISTLPPDYEETNYCADIHLSSDGKFLYGSNRGHNSVAIFEINPRTKKLKHIDTVSSRGNWPRNFAISPDGYYLLIANQKSDNITVFRIDKNTGIPEYTGNEINLPAPVCIEFL
jgi:6-phosphogluconolactonase